MAQGAKVKALIRRHGKAGLSFLKLNVRIYTWPGERRPCPGDGVNQFRRLRSQKVKELLKHPGLYRPENVYDPDRMKKMGSIYLRGKGQGLSSEAEERDWIFVSDAHFTGRDAGEMESFIRFVELERRGRALFILGDFFEFLFGFKKP